MAKHGAFRTTILRIGLSLFALVLLIALLEGASRLLWDFQGDDIRMSKPAPRRINTVCEYDAYLGWKNRANIELEQSYVHGKTPVRVLERTNSQGLRSPQCSTNKPRDVFRVVTLGCSRTYGLGVNQDETYPHYLQQLLSTRLEQRIEVLNFGVNAYGVDQMALMFENYAKHFEPDLVFLQLYRPNVDRIQYNSNWHTPKPAFSLVDGTLVLRNVPVPKNRLYSVEDWLARHSYLFASIKRRRMRIEQLQQKKRESRLPTHDLYLLASKILERLKQQTDALNVPLVVFVWGPSGRKLMPIAAEPGINTIDLRDFEDASTWIETAPLNNPPPIRHWSAHGNRYVATALCNYVLKSGIAEPVEKAKAVPE